MSIRFQADNDLSGLIVAAALRREPAIDFQTAQVAGLDRLDDLAVLRLSAQEGRILVTHDKRSMPRHFAEFLREGHGSPGVLVVIPQDAPLVRVVETLILIWARGLGERHHEDPLLSRTGSSRTHLPGS